MPRVYTLLKHSIQSRIRVLLGSLLVYIHTFCSLQMKRLRLTPTNNKDNDENDWYGYGDLPDEVRGHVGRMLAPCDVFRLCLADARCFVLPPQLDTDISNGSGNSLTSCHGKKMLHHTLLRSLERTLQSNEAGFGCSNIVSSFARLAASLPPGSVAMSGSIVLQAVLGDIWSSDIDIFCTSEVSSVVRTWIVTVANQALFNCAPGYTHEMSYPDGPFDSAIQFIESYCNVPRENKILQNELTGERWVFHRKAATYRNGVVPYDYHHTLHSDHEICTTGVPIVFDPRLSRDSRLKKNIDLVIARQGRNLDDIVSLFDIDICRCLFNGKSFNIPRPFDTYNRRSALNMNVFNNHAIVCYMNALLVECRRSFSTILRNHLTAWSHEELTSMHWPTHTNERPGVGALVFLPELDVLVWSRQFRITVQRIRANLIRTALYRMLLVDYDTFGHLVDRNRPISTHNIYVNLFNRRVGKYMARGIDFTNLPPVIPHVMRILPRGL